MDPTGKAHIKQPHISKTLSGFSIFWMSFPVSYLLFAAFVLSVGTDGFLKLLLSPYYWLISAIAVLSAYALLQIKWYGWYLYLASHLLVFYQTATILTSFSSAGNKFLIFLISVAAQGLCLFVIAREVRVPYYFPKIRWWESDPRYRLSVQAKITRLDGAEFEGEIMDISGGGCFLKTHAYFPLDDEILLDFTIFNHSLKTSGLVVWRTESRVTHPKGIGVKFIPLAKESLLILKESTKKLQLLNRSYTQMTREKNWKEYLSREQSYQGKSNPDSKNKRK